MVILVPLLALVVGLLLGAVISDQVPPALTPYLAVAVLAGLDSVIGGTRSHLEGKFQTDVFSTGFLFNILIATFFVWLGNGIGLNLTLAAVVVFGMRMFTNLSLIRRMMLTRLSERRARQKFERAMADQPRSSDPEQAPASPESAAH